LLEALPAYARLRDELLAPTTSPAQGPPAGPLRLSAPDAARGLLLAGLAEAAGKAPRQSPGAPTSRESGPKDDEPGGPQGIRGQGCVLVVTARPEEAQRLADELTMYLGGEGEEEAANGTPRVLLFPESEALPFERLEVDEGVVQGRLRVLAALAGGHALNPSSLAPDTNVPGSNGNNSRNPQGAWVQGCALVVASVAALLQRTLAHETFLESCHTLRVGQRVQTEELLRRWLAMGYAIDTAVEVPGTVSRRGGILDIYPPHQALPARIELVGDAIESIRLFDPATQRSQEQVDSILLVPAQEMLPRLAGAGQDLHPSLATPSFRESDPEGEQVQGTALALDLEALASGARVEGSAFYAGFFNTGSLLDYLNPESVLVLAEPQQIERVAADLAEQEASLRTTKEAQDELPPGFPSPRWPWERIRGQMEGWSRRVHLEWLGATGEAQELGVAAAPTYWGRLEEFAAGVGKLVQEGRRVVLLSHHGQRLAELLQDHGVGAGTLSEPPAPGSVSLVGGSLPEGFRLSLADGDLVLLTDKEIFGQSKRRHPVRRRSTRREAFFSDLKPGTYVVHVDHGIGLFVGTHRIAGDQGEKEYLTLEYAEGDRLYVPPEHLDRLSPYGAPREEAPNVTRLGTQEWARAKARASKAAREMAQELLSLYAARRVLQGHAFAPDTVWQQEMEEGFPYVETPDQMEAILEVKAGMEEPRPLDRLICGDVGYGKTEIALRAAFKAVQDGKQVAFLCPTTILAQQHYATFTDRLSPYPVRIEVLSRFRTEAEQQDVVDRLRTGSVDIVVGTHRLVQKDVVFRDLGLLIIDDEQRFGVTHKERFKQLRRELDVLTLTATPIPRTLYMALSGVRDMSTIETPPESRQPVRTFVSEYSDDLVREAVLREIERGGQVFFVHNRIRNIAEWAAKVQSLVPDARVAVGHGRMDEGELAKVMAKFVEGRADVLVCTTIIEAGLDLPNANTIIVHSPELLGLAQMYQLRGRVGRGAHMAYAYFLVPRGKRITEAAEKRLRAILAHQELGSGFRIAMKDLEIRGAGNLLGSQQSGHIHAVGFELYVRLLEEAVADLKAEEGGAPRSPQLPQVNLNLPLEASIPSDYVEDLPMRLGLYQRLARVPDYEAVEELRQELRDRFGEPPEEVASLLYGVRVKLLAASAGVESVATEGDYLALRLRESLGGAGPALQRQLGPRARVGDRLIRLEIGSAWREHLVTTLEDVAAFRERVLALVGSLQ
jgi:transcription-repair coupling factor (superfamily II helicase)